MMQIIGWILCLFLVVKAFEMAANGVHLKSEGGSPIGILAIALCIVGAIAFAVLIYFGVPRDSLRTTLPSTVSSDVPQPRPAAAPAPSTVPTTAPPPSADTATPATPTAQPADQFDENALIQCLENASTAAEVEAC